MPSVRKLVESCYRKSLNEEGDFKDQEHPRANDGKFTSGGGQSKPASKASPAKKAGKKPAVHVSQKHPQIHGKLHANSEKVKQVIGDLAPSEIGEYLSSTYGDEWSKGQVHDMLKAGGVTDDEIKKLSNKDIVDLLRPHTSVSKREPEPEFSPYSHTGRYKHGGAP